MASESVDSCGAGEIRVEDQCLPVVCQASTRLCLDVVEYEICNDFGTDRTRSTCSEDEICYEGTCVVSDCLPGQQRCNETGHRERCARDGRFETDPCPTGQGCRQDEQGVRCEAQICSPGSTRCEDRADRDPSLQRCAASGTEWEDVRCHVALSEICLEIDGVSGCHRPFVTQAIGAVSTSTPSACAMGLETAGTPSKVATEKLDKCVLAGAAFGSVNWRLETRLTWAASSSQPSWAI